MTLRIGGTVGLVCAFLGLAPVGSAQPVASLADLRWSVNETTTGRFVIVPGRRAFVGGYNVPGLEIWTYPLQLLHGYWVSFRLDGDTAEIDGRSALRSIEHSPIAAMRIYGAPGVTVRERIFTAPDLPAATISYAVQSSRPVLITVHFTPSLNLMWPGAVGGQEIHWDSTRSAYTLDEPSHRFRGAIVSPQIVGHEQTLNNTRGAEFERTLTFTLRAGSGSAEAVHISFAGTSTPGENPLAIAESLATKSEQYETRARDRYAQLHVIDIETPDSAVNRALHWAQATLEQAWVCNPQLGCGLVAGYGPSRGARRPQYAWFFAGDGLVAVDALLREGAYARARAELEFIMGRQNKRTGAIWHELSQSAGFLDWEGSYPYMFVHVDVSFDFLNTVRDYVETTGDVAFAVRHWNAIRSAYDYCKSTIPRGRSLPEIPAGQQGRDEQDPQRDELTLSLGWVTAAESFATLSRLTSHGELAVEADKASKLGRDAIRPTYYDARRAAWVSGHLRSGAAVEGLTSSSIALLHHRLLSEREQRALVDELAAPAYRAPWGIRSTPSNSPLYDPDSYARGSVWAIGTADAIMAFYEAGQGETATALWRGLVPWFGLDATGHMHEVLRGDAFTPERESVPDQTWSSASFVWSAVRGVLGIQLDGAKRALHFAPRLPGEWDSLRVRRIDLGGSDVGLALRTSPEVVELEIDNSGPAMTLTFQPALPTGARVRGVEVSEGARVVASREGAGALEVAVRCPAHRASRVVLRVTRPMR
jgi:glycogen debranching enzyme